MKNIHYSYCKQQHGITGLETAIILIAFVVVAAVFAFTVLSSGIFASERSKETVYSGLKETTSTLEPKSGVIAVRGDVDGENAIVQLRFHVGGTVAGESVDLTPPYVFDDTGTDPDPSGLEAKTVLGFTNAAEHVSEVRWTVEFAGGSSGDYLLDRGEMAEITVWLHEKNTAVGDYNLGTAGSGHLSTRLGTNDHLSIEVNADQGGFFSVERRIPSRLLAIMDLR